MSWDKLSNESNKIDKKQVLEERKKEKEKIKYFKTSRKAQQMLNHYILSQKVCVIEIVIF